MKKRFNFTDRKKIHANLIQSTIEHADNEVYLNISIDFSSMSLSADARVYIEYYLVGSGLHKKLYAGTVQDFTTPRNISLDLPTEDHAVRGEFFVVAPNDARILASTRGAIALGGGKEITEARKKSPLPIYRTLDSKSELWRVDIKEEGFPILLIPHWVDDASAFLTNEVAALIMPQVLRIIAQWVFDETLEKASDDDEENEVLPIWRAIFEECYDDFDFQNVEISREELREEYARLVVEGYTRNRQLIREFKMTFLEDEDA